MQPRHRHACDGGKAADRPLDAALLQQKEMLKLPQPRRYDITLLQDWLSRPEGGNNFLGPDEDGPWLEGEEGDPAALSSSNYDRLTYCIKERIMPSLVHSGLLHKRPAPGHEATGLVQWPASFFCSISKAISVMTSTLVPSLAITALYLIDKMAHRILAACLLTFTFSSALALATSVRPAELFVATTTYVNLSPHPSNRGKQ